MICRFSSGSSASIPAVNDTHAARRSSPTATKRYPWHSIALVATAQQDTRARLRVGRCFGGKSYVANPPLPASEWPDAIVCEWAATFNALFLQRI